MRRNFRQGFLLFTLSACCSAAIFSQASFPEIRALNANDALFAQLTGSVSETYQALAQGQKPPPAMLFQYRVPVGMDLFQLAARCNLPYETLATLNRLSSPASCKPGMLLIIPSCPGIYLPEQPLSELEILMKAWRDTQGSNPQVLVLPVPGKPPSRFFLLANGRFLPTERAFFLQTLFRFPLERGRLTSSYGTRVSPITGRVHFHGGIDLAAPLGSKVLASRAGTVLASGSNDTLGEFIIIGHEDDYRTVYGHLSKRHFAQGAKVTAGQHIADSGNTGLSTGPHLHFEVYHAGQSRDPSSLLPSMPGR